MTDIPTYSFSRLNSFSTCPYEYYLNYIVPREDRPDSASNGFASLGSFAHSILEDFGNKEILQFELKSKFIEEFDENVPNGVRLYFENGAYRDLTDKYKNQCIDFFENFNGFPDYEQVGVEEDFKILVKINEKKMILRGIIDCILKDDDNNYVIIDFKSKSEFKTAEELKEYARQLYFYSLWIKYKFGVFPKTMKFLQFRIGVTKEVKFNEEDLNETLDWIYNQSEKIENEVFWEAFCMNLPIKKDGKEDTFYVDNLCQFRFSCKYSRHYLGDGATS
jgi:hypothetical protein